MSNTKSRLSSGLSLDALLRVGLVFGADRYLHL
jgi:hypothetical protein